MGGLGNKAAETFTLVAGGAYSEALGFRAGVLGGELNKAIGEGSWIFGTYGREAKSMREIIY